MVERKETYPMLIALLRKKWRHDFSLQEIADACGYSKGQAQYWYGVLQKRKREQNIHNKHFNSIINKYSNGS